MRLDYELAATVLAEATLEDDRTVCERHGITPRTLRNYRYRLQSDPELSLLFRERLRTLEREWANELAPAPTVWGYTPSGPATRHGWSGWPLCVGTPAPALSPPGPGKEWGPEPVPAPLE